MALQSKIEWTEATWNPVRGCVKISPGCKHCYAETFAERFRDVPGYATRNPKGILEFRKVGKRTMNEQDTVRASAQRQYRETHTRQGEFAFDTPGDLSGTTQDERERGLRLARERLFAAVQQGPIRYEQSQPLILEIPLVWNSDLTTILREARREGRLTITGMRPNERTPKEGCVIRLPD